MQGPGEILSASAARFPRKTALITEDRTLSYAELDRAAANVAARLVADGIRPGDRVSLYSQNRWEWIAAYHGALRAGAVVNPINVMLTAEEVRFVLRHCRAGLLFAARDQLAGLEGVVDEVDSLRGVVCFDDPPPGARSAADYLAGPGAFEPVAVSPDLPSTIGYTSGTTGVPKGAVQSQRAVLLNCEATARMHGRTEADVVVTALPTPHVYGNVAVNSTFLVGGTVVLMERFDAGEALRLIQEHRATLFEGVPAMYSMLLAHDDLDRAELGTLTRCTVGGQTIARSTVERWERVSGARLIELWGMTELSGLGTTHWYDGEPRPGSIGVALPDVEVRVGELGDSRRTAPPGVPGELLVRGPLVMLGYFDDDEATAAAVDADGWLHTGDIAHADEDGHFFVVDRRKDMIVTAGYNVYPAEIERVLAGHPAVAMVAVGPVPDEVKGELARAYVVPAAAVTEDELIEYCRERLAAYKLPRSVRFVEQLPRTSTGKIMRRALAGLVDS
ncbi:class I adenylate-forming enzyme family protein [Saccharopolyspora rosea]|uniref:Class I adenylate-forming enzyme family protein n=1 Tax=Saccharopolyspora rosea TaxID=524884 RepID=A0ABW3FS87_9PSEU|nr:AMP-binding protein [Saccharopolyspora rosea]